MPRAVFTARGNWSRAKIPPSRSQPSATIIASEQTDYMHICYIDDSGDDHIRVFSALAVPVDSWSVALNQFHAYRRKLKQREGIYVRVEFHATEFVSGRGKISTSIVPKGARCRIFEETLSEIAGLPGVHLFNAAAPKHEETKIFERMLNRINRTMQAWDSKCILVSDEGKDYTGLLRKMRVHNPIPSQFQIWPDGSPNKNITLDRIIEDLFFRDSKRSYFIQMADFCAYALLRSERPLASKNKYGLDKSFSLVTPICLPQCFGKDPRKLGIIREI